MDTDPPPQVPERTARNASKQSAKRSLFDQWFIPLAPVGWERMIALALQFNLTAYSASYLALPEGRGEEVTTGDLRLFNAVRGSLPWVRWIGDWQG